MNWLPAKAKTSIRKLLGDSLVGTLEYYYKPSRSVAWGGPFNGQQSRRALFLALIDRFNPVAIVETGTFLGTTTAFMAETGIPIYTIEENSRSYGFAKAHLRRKRNVTLLQGDSRAKLRALFADLLHSAKDQSLFVYLDAHGSTDLPLAEELEIIFTHCPAAVVMIDDFQVHDDPGYEFDRYGPNKDLTFAYVEPTILARQLAAFYPAVPAAEETGMRRGCLVLALRSVHGEALSSLSHLRQVQR